MSDKRVLFCFGCVSPKPSGRGQKDTFVMQDMSPITSLNVATRIVCHIFLNTSVYASSQFVFVLIKYCDFYD